MSEKPPSFSTREFLIGDYASALALWGKVEGVDISEGDSLEEIRGYLARNSGLSRVAVEGEQIVGAALCGHDGRRGFIYHIAVDPACGGRGIGKVLVNECMAGLKAAGITRALILVAGENATGRDFWRKNGWEELPWATPMAKDL